MNSQTTELPELPEAHGWIGANDIDPDAGVEGYTADQMRAYARAALEHAQRVAQPATGWMLVPQQPTPEMIGAMAVIPATCRITGSLQINGGYTLGMAGAEEAYAAMLAATPSAGEAEARDAARYRWLCEHKITACPSLWSSGIGFHVPLFDGMGSHRLEGAELDAAIDAAMASGSAG